MHQHYKAILKLDDHFKLIEQGIELSAASEERENKQKNAKF